MTTQYEYRELGATVNKIARQANWSEERIRFTYDLYKELLLEDIGDWMEDANHENGIGKPSIWMTDAAWKRITEHENAIWTANQPKPPVKRPHMGRGFTFEDMNL